MIIQKSDYATILKVTAAVPKETAVTFTKNAVIAETCGVTVQAKINWPDTTTVAFPAGVFKKSLFKGDSTFLGSIPTVPVTAEPRRASEKGIEELGTISADDAMVMFYTAKKAKDFPMFVANKGNTVLCANLYSSSSYGITFVDAVSEKNFSFSVDKDYSAGIIKALSKIGGDKYILEKSGDIIVLRQDNIDIIFDSLGDSPALKDWTNVPTPTAEYGFPDMTLKKKYTVIAGDTITDSDDKSENCYLSTTMRDIKKVMGEDEKIIKYAETDTLGYFFNKDFSACFVCGKMKK